ncbi:MULTISPECIES: hypothetical protein [Pandoraea]|uniref:Conjugal transfer protein TraB n=2 Tax=Pandoraea TaxID=93217 RepID=A0A5E4XCB8_9BURK|nr:MULTISPECIES: hypothetical protein [Pandoraea]VVE16288.1 hypothetical protein PCE31107_02909 [Pandoraea cepalis]VVE33994.1 hypothetical protein PTE31013_03824 [Pandoraea terrigena]
MAHVSRFRIIRPILIFACLFFCGVLCARPPAAAAGYVALPAALWCLRELGKTSLLYLLGWFLGALSSVAIGVLDVGAGRPMALTIWLALALLSTLFTAPAFSRRATPVERSAWVFIPLSLPPLALVAPLPPAAAAGWWFPSTSVLGVLFTIWTAAAVLEAVKRPSWRPLFVPTFCAVLLNVYAVLVPAMQSRVIAMSLPVGKPPVDFDESIRAALSYGPIVRGAAAVPIASGAPTPIVMLPENVLGPVSPGLVDALQLPSAVRLIAGGSGAVPWAEHLQKGVWVLPDRVFYPAIQPIPVIEDGLKPHWSAIGRTAKIGDERYSLLVCFEAVTSLPLYHLHYRTPVLLLGNGWWDRSGIMDIEVSLARAWARLFNDPIAIARGFPL